MDITHVPEFGHLKYLPVVTDTFSRFIFASLHTGEASKNAIAHVLNCLSVMGKPKIIKQTMVLIIHEKIFKSSATDYSLSMLLASLIIPKDRTLLNELTKHSKTLSSSQKGVIYTP